MPGAYFGYKKDVKHVRYLKLTWRVSALHVLHLYTHMNQFASEAWTLITMLQTKRPVKFCVIK